MEMIVYVTDYLENSPAKKNADYALLYDVKDVSGIVKFCKEEHIDGVISTSLDPCQVPYQKICRELGVPCFGTAEQFHILTDKVAFKECCKRYGVDIIDTYSAKELEEYKKSGRIKEILPVLIKPTDSRGSRGQTVCCEADAIQAAIEAAQLESSTGEIVIEKYMEHKDDFTAAYLFMRGKAVLVRTGDRYVGTQKMGLNKVAIASASPSRHTQMYLTHVHDRVVHMLNDIGIVNGPVFFQGFADGNTVRLYDPGFRFSGGEYERLFFEATKINLIKMLVQFAIIGDFESMIEESDLSHLNGMRIMQLCPTLRAGKICKIKGVDAIMKHENVVSFAPRYSEGDVVPSCNDVRRRYAEICTLCESKDREREVLQFIQKELVIQDEWGNDLICDKLNIDVI
ncbi:MAG: hypothetical protein K2I22_10170 [Lachnospiraceae bacterium]|nr:hypothetical protein [Lachnospiraceae bacterium]